MEPSNNDGNTAFGGSLELLADIQPMLISSCYLDENEMEAAEYSQHPATMTRDMGESRAVEIVADMASMNHTSSVSDQFPSRKSAIEMKKNASTTGSSSSMEPVSATIDSACYQSGSKTVVDLPVVTNSNGGSGTGRNEPLASKDNRGQVEGAVSADWTSTSSGSAEMPTAPKPLEKRKTLRKEEDMRTAKLKTAKLESVKGRNSSNNGGIARNRDAPARPSAKPSKHAEIMAKLKESIRLEKDRPKKEIKSRFSLAGTKVAITATQKTLEKENCPNGRSALPTVQSTRVVPKKSTVQANEAINRKDSSMVKGYASHKKLSPTEEKYMEWMKTTKALKGENEKLIDACVALCFVIDYFNRETIPTLDHDLQSWKKKAEHLSSALNEKTDMVDQLAKEKQQLKTENETFMHNLEEQYKKKLVELETALTLKNHIQKEQLLRNSEENVKKLRETFEIEKKYMCAELTRVRLSESEKLKAKLRYARNEQCSELERLKKEWRETYAHMQDQHAKSVLNYTAEIRDLKTKCERYRNEACHLERTLMHDNEKKEQARKERVTNYVKEIESLQAVLEMKNEQNRELQAKLKDLEKEVEDIEKMKARIILLEQKNDELKEALELKKMAEKRLTLRHGDLLRTCEREKANSKKLKMDKEQLQFQLEQVMMSKSAYETPIHRPSNAANDSYTNEEDTYGPMSQSLIQIYADCSPRHSKERPVTVYTHEGVQTSATYEDERRLRRWGAKNDLQRSRHYSGGVEQLFSDGDPTSPTSRGRNRRRVQSNCETNTAVIRMHQSSTGCTGTAEQTDDDDDHSTKMTKNGSTGSSLDCPTSSCCIDSGIFVASCHSDNNDIVKTDNDEKTLSKSCPAE